VAWMAEARVKFGVRDLCIDIPGSVSGRKPVQYCVYSLIVTRLATVFDLSDRIRARPAKGI
jgi:hypothetical protein